MLACANEMIWYAYKYTQNSCVFNIFKTCLKIVIYSWYVRKSLPFVGRATSTVFVREQCKHIGLILLGNVLVVLWFAYYDLKMRTCIVNCKITEREAVPSLLFMSECHVG